MTADEIARKLEKIASEADGNRLHNECHARIAEIEQRRRDISRGHPIYGDPPERQRAIVKGNDAVKRLDDELASLSIEQDRVGVMADLAIKAGHKAERERIAAELPRAANRLPQLERNIGKALDQLLAVMAEHTAAVEVVGRYSELGVPRPLTDGEIANTLRLRERFWNLPKLAVIAPTPEDLESAALYFVKRGSALSPTISVRQQNQMAADLLLQTEPVVRKTA